MADRLRTSRIKAGYPSATAAAEAFGWKEPAYRHHENGSRSFDVETAVRYGKAFKVNPSWLLGIDMIDAPPVRFQNLPAERYLIEVVGAVAAGVWREQTNWASSDRYQIEVGPPPFPNAERFAVRMDGRSMDLTIPPGSELECLRAGFGSRVEPQPGDLVIVARQAHDLTEMTCKRLDRDGETYLLRAESTLAEFADPIIIGAPDRDSITDDTVQVIGIVLRAHQRLLSRRL